VKKRSKQNNPEQKTRNGINNDIELGKDVDPVKQAKKAYEQTGGQPQKSKQHVEE
jgi:hypothetical protein